MAVDEILPSNEWDLAVLVDDYDSWGLAECL